MALDLEKILKHVGESLQVFSQNVSISEDILKSCADGTKQLTAEEAGQIEKYTGLGFEELEKTAAPVHRREKVSVDDTWTPSEMAKTDLRKYIEEGADFSSEEVVTEINKIRLCIANWKKPRVVFAGQSDTGKSTMINELIGGDNLPAKWTPTTSISTYIKHITDRPDYIHDSVWIFGKYNGTIWDSDKLDDENYTNQFVIAKGDISLLEEYGTHQREEGRPKEAYSAVVFVDADVLKDCDIVDLPGLAANKEDNALHEISTQKNKTDILIYLSRANGFLQDRDLDYLKVCMNSLMEIERADSKISKLENLFIVATHARSVSSGNIGELNEILNNQCRRLCKILRESAHVSYGQATTSLLPRRSEITSMDYNEEDIRNRFFTYDKSMERLNKNYYESMEKVLQIVPEEIQIKFTENLNSIAASSKTSLKNKIEEYNRIIDDTKKYIELSKNLKAKEPARKAEQESKNRQIKKEIENCCIESKQEITSFLTDYLCEESLIAEMDKSEIKNKKEDKSEFVTTVNTVINDKIQKIIDDKSKKYTNSLDSFLNEYKNSLNISDDINGVKVEIDTDEAFRFGIATLGAIGATATWLASSAFQSVLFPQFARAGIFASLGGLIGVAISSVLGFIITVVAMALTWKKSLAKEIIKAYEQEDYEQKILDKVDSYWKETAESFDRGCNKIEEAWAKKIREYESLSNEQELAKKEQKLQELNKGLSFFESMPMPSIG